MTTTPAAPLASAPVTQPLADTLAHVGVSTGPRRVTAHEIRHLILEPFLPVLNRQVRAALKRVIAASPARPFQLLDVGGRRSPYTVGLDAEVTVSDLKRESDVQKQLNLGFSDALVSHLKANRSNVKAVVYDDMTQTALPPASFDAVVAVEVLEHVEEDAKFVENVARTLKAGGTFVMTTPNGDCVPNKNPDHKRHYGRQQLFDLLSAHFPRVTVDYAIRMDVFYRMAVRSWSFRKPHRAARAMLGNALGSFTCARPSVKGRAQGTAHLFAVASK